MTIQSLYTNQTGKVASILATFGVSFFIWGIITGLNTYFTTHLAHIFHLSYSVSTLIQLTFYATYLIVSLPAGNLIRSWGYKLGLIIGLFTTGLGCMLFYFAIYLENYFFFLGALVVQATGITLLQVGANLYILFFGQPNTAVSRLTLMQGLNALGAFLAPIYGGEFIESLFGLNHESAGSMTYIAKEIVFVQSPYILLSIVMYFLTVFFVFVDIPEFVTKDIEPLNRESSQIKRSHVMHFKQLRLGAFAVFAYLGAEVALGNFMVNFYVESTKYYWGAALLGRIIGALLLLKFTPRRMLYFSSGSATIMLIISSIAPSPISTWTAVSIGLFNAIMFPCIYSLGLSGLGKYSEEGSAIMIMAFVGGGVIPFNAVNFASAFGPKVAFIFPFISYLYIYFYATIGSRYKTRKDLDTPQSIFSANVIQPN